MNRKGSNLIAALTIFAGGIFLSSPALAAESAAFCSLRQIIDVASAWCGDQSARVTNIHNNSEGCSFNVECF